MWLFLASFSNNDNISMILIYLQISEETQAGQIVLHTRSVGLSTCGLDDD